MSYPRQPSSPSTSYFPASPSSPFSFAAMQQQQSPRDKYSMYADLRMLSSNSSGQTPRAAHSSTASSFKRMFRKN
ncbi:hypothetical protein EW145_g7346 [Phellinidium pouzarii]|uniref:Uncharacterized protein n=1 Tax=Phellinidium pouzarii TaxID=167371 RepID=A0A4S4KL40_9AGAM|nr:hypothetical protein EW145_g7346 [Phellinidium pouzarii]